ncbi:hypothetical protein SGRIM128S_07382 [Streptomyces griseomycini]
MPLPQRSGRSAGTGTRRLARTAAALAAALALLAPLDAAGAASAAEPGTPAADVGVRVNTQASLGRLHDTARGVNTAVWDSHMNDPEVAALMKAADVGAMRYPGGSYADIYHWETHTAPGGYVAPGTDFDSFMGTVRAAGAQPILIANYGSGTPEEAAGWVRYANVTKDYGVRYWEIGNEIYGNGHYGNGWEHDEHEDKSPREYARQVRAYAEAMKAVDPTVEIGAVLTTPGHWPDGVVGEGDPGDWNHTVLSEVTDVIDFVSVHWYAGGSDTTAEDAMARLARLPGELREVRSQIDRYAGADSPRIGIALTEINTNTGGARLTARPNGLFAADAYLTALENGVFTVDWWNTHNGPGQITTVDGETDYGDMGMLSSGSCTGDVCEPAPNTPFHPYYGMKMTSELGTAGDTLVAAASSAQDVSAHAVHRRDGRLSVLLVNKDPDAARTVDLEYAGFTPSAAAPEVSRYARGDSDVTAVTDGGASAYPGHRAAVRDARPHAHPAGRHRARGLRRRGPGDPAASGGHRHHRAPVLGGRAGRRPLPGPGTRRRPHRAGRRDHRHLRDPAEPAPGQHPHGQRAGGRRLGTALRPVRSADLHHRHPAGRRLRGDLPPVTRAGATAS